MEALLYILLLVSSARGSFNVLSGKTIYTSSDPTDTSTLKDRKTPTCFTSSSSFFNWVVFDLNYTFKVTNIVIESATSDIPVSIYFGDSFTPCQFQKQYKSYSICQSGVIQKSPSIQVNCNEDGNTGRYLAIVQGEFAVKDSINKLTLCEVQALGTFESFPAVRSRPAILSQPLPSVSPNDFAVAMAIRNGVKSFTVPIYSQSFSYLNNCQPLIWDSSTLFVFSIACQTPDGNGRLVAFGKSNVFNGIMKGNQPTLKANLISWLSPKATSPAIISKTSIKSMQDLLKVKPGDILDFNVPVPYPDDVLAQIVNMVKNGTLGINIDWTNYVGTSQAGVNSYMQIMNIFNINFKYDFVTWDSATDFDLRDSDFTDNILSADIKLSRVAMNHDYLLSSGLKLSQMINSFSQSVISNSDIIRIQMLNLISKYDPIMQLICPCAIAPATNANDRLLIDIYTQLVKSQGLVNSNYKLPCIELYPGDFDIIPPKNVVTLFLNTSTDATDSPIGYYLAAGSTLTYVVKQSSGPWSISVGCQSDYLGSTRPSWTRYPNIYISRIMLNAKGDIYSPFGGALWLYNEVANQTITLTISNVIATPFFNLRSSSAASDWEKQKNNPGLYAQIAGDNMIFCDASSAVRTLSGTYLVDLMKNDWDNLVKMDLAIKNINWWNEKPEWTVTDLMTSLGYGHSGYPIEIYYDWSPSIFNTTFIMSQGYWGMCHELGHNMQESVWTWKGLSEVTNNNLCLFNHDKLWHLPRYGSDINTLFGNNAKIIAHLNGPPTYKTWSSSPWISLGIYAQMANNFGWGFYKQVFAFYLANIVDLDTDADEINMWINATCTVSRQNLMPMFDFWGIPVDPSVSSAVSKLPCFFPNDFWATMSSTRTAYIKAKYPSCSSVSTFFQDYDPSVDIAGMRPNTIFELSSSSQ